MRDHKAQSCNDCGIKTTTKRSMTRHQKTKHPEKELEDEVNNDQSINFYQLHENDPLNDTLVLEKDSQGDYIFDF